MSKQDEIKYIEGVLCYWWRMSSAMKTRNGRESAEYKACLSSLIKVQGDYLKALQSV